MVYVGWAQGLGNKEQSDALSIGLFFSFYDLSQLQGSTACGEK